MPTVLLSHIAKPFIPLPAPFLFPSLPVPSLIVNHMPFNFIITLASSPAPPPESSSIPPPPYQPSPR
ncbi:hypothetical protein H4Q26_001164, partial [Puccinia striiformis f. sp. tritici PST-130]